MYALVPTIEAFALQHGDETDRAARAPRARLDDARVTALVLAAGKGDEAAFTEWVKLTHPLALRTALAVTGDVDDAEDVIQDAYVKAWRALGTLDSPTAAVAWLITVCRRGAIDRLRQKKPWARLDDETRAIRAESLLAKEAPPDAVFHDKETRAVLGLALAELSDEYRAVIVLRDLEGHTAEEAAMLLGVPVGTVESRSHRGRVKLAAALAKIARRKR